MLQQAEEILAKWAFVSSFSKDNFSAGGQKRTTKYPQQDCVLSKQKAQLYWQSWPELRKIIVNTSKRTMSTWLKGLQSLISWEKDL